jgi:hypothetical protein
LIRGLEDIIAGHHTPKPQHAVVSPEQVREIFKRVASQLVRAGWVKRYEYTAEAGHELVWEPVGAQHALFLKDLSEKFALADFDLRPLYFYQACMGMPAPAGTSFPSIAREVCDFWLSCVRELELEGDGDGLLGLVQMVTHWGPDAASSGYFARVGDLESSRD